jgi:hypothetical protein
MPFVNSSTGTVSEPFSGFVCVCFLPSGAASSRRGKKHDPVLDLLTPSAFIGTDGVLTSRLPMAPPEPPPSTPRRAVNNPDRGSAASCRIEDPLNKKRLSGAPGPVITSGARDLLFAWTSEKQIPHAQQPGVRNDNSKSLLTVKDSSSHLFPRNGKGWCTQWRTWSERLKSQNTHSSKRSLSGAPDRFGGVYPQ